MTLEPLQVIPDSWQQCTLLFGSLLVTTKMSAQLIHWLIIWLIIYKVMSLIEVELGKSVLGVESSVH